VNLGTKDFTYYCDEKCNDYQYQVKSGRYPSCKHYPAVIAELLYGGHLDITEIEPNYISGKVLESLINMVDAHIRACRGELIEKPEPRRYAVKRIIYAPARCRVGEIKTRGVHDLPLPGAIIEEGEPLVTVLASHNSMEAAENLASIICSRVRKELNYLRR